MWSNCRFPLRWPSRFKSFVAAAKCYLEALGKDPLIHRKVVSAISGLREFLEIERKRRIMDAVRDAGLTQIDHLILTHYHADQFGGMEELTCIVERKLE